MSEPDAGFERAAGADQSGGSAEHADVRRPDLPPPAPRSGGAEELLWLERISGGLKVLAGAQIAALLLDYLAAAPSWPFSIWLLSLATWTVWVIALTAGSWIVCTPHAPAGLAGHRSRRVARAVALPFLFASILTGGASVAADVQQVLLPIWLDYAAVGVMLGNLLLLVSLLSYLGAVLAWISATWLRLLLCTVMGLTVLVLPLELAEYPLAYRVLPLETIWQIRELALLPRLALIVLLLAVMVSAWLLLHRRADRLRPWAAAVGDVPRNADGCIGAWTPCAGCRNERRGLAPAGRCPQCGQEIAASVAPDLVRNLEPARIRTAALSLLLLAVAALGVAGNFVLAYSNFGYGFMSVYRLVFIAAGLLALLAAQRLQPPGAAAGAGPLSARNIAAALLAAATVLLIASRVWPSAEFMEFGRFLPVPLALIAFGVSCWAAGHVAADFAARTAHRWAGEPIEIASALPATGAGIILVAQLCWRQESLLSTALLGPGLVTILAGTVLMGLVCVLIAIRLRRELRVAQACHA